MKKYASLWLLILIAACVPFKELTPEQQAYRLYGQFVILEETAARLILDDAVPASVKENIRSADAKAKVIVDALIFSTLELEDMRRAVAAGSGDEEKIQILTERLSRSLLAANSAVADLARVLEKL